MLNCLLDQYRWVFLLYFGLLSVQISGQSANVGLRFIADEVSEGYVLFSPERNQSVYLINSCGEVINEWTFSQTPLLTCYLLENGNLLRAGLDSLEIRDWESNLVWSYPTRPNGIDQHHDIEPLPNGNILCIVSDLYSHQQIISMGRNPALSPDVCKLDKIIELQPNGSHDATVVWEWKFADHLIQDYDSTKLNFGIVSQHPELLDLNYDHGQPIEYTHINSIDYNAELQQILISARYLSELYIIDHSVGQAGEISGKSSEILFRWGNDQVYRGGTRGDQKLFDQHDARWVEEGYPDAGMISVFNNGGDGSNTFSSIHLLELSFGVDGYFMKDSTFLPDDFFWSWNGSVLGQTVNEGRKCGVQEVGGGHLLLCQSAKGQIAELTKEGEVVWVYRNPSGVKIYDQDDQINSASNGIFRADKYPVGFPGFSGHHLTPREIIETENDVSADCVTTTDIADASSDDILIVNPVQSGLIRMLDPVQQGAIFILDLNGRMMYQKDLSGEYTLETHLPEGFYFLTLTSAKGIQNFKILILD